MSATSRTKAAVVAAKRTLKFFASSVPPTLHEQYEIEDDLVVFRCSECGYISMSLGALHGHAESHRGYTRLGIQIPFTKTAAGDYDRLMEYTEVLRVGKTEEIDLEEVEAFA